MRLANISTFYHVYNAGGIHPGARRLRRTPSAVSISLAGLEEDLGFTLFQRKPWEPLPVAHEFYHAVAAPVVEGAAAFARRARGMEGPVLRVAASEHILHEYLVPLLLLLQEHAPALRVTLQAARRDEIADRVRERSIDLAVVTTDEPPSGLSWQPFLTVQPVLVVRRDSGIKNVDTLLAAGGKRPRLVCPPEGEGVCQRFAALLAERQVHWAVATVASSTALVPWIVSQSNCVGLSVAARTLIHPGTRVLPLPVAPLTVGAFWLGEGPPTLRRMLELFESGARKVAELRDPNGPARAKPAMASQPR